jgi:quercetin dioxygenase-like cupin family protein
VIYALQGSITFGLPQEGRKIHLSAGDRLDLPAGITHDAVVGGEGVVCLEGHRSAVG